MTTMENGSNSGNSTNKDIADITTDVTDVMKHTLDPPQVSLKSHIDGDELNKSDEMNANGDELNTDDSSSSNTNVKDDGSLHLKLQKIIDVLHIKGEVSECMDIDDAILKDGRNTRFLLASTVKDLVIMCKETLSLLGEKELVTKPPAVTQTIVNENVVSESIASIIKGQLTALLPAALKEAMAEEAKLKNTTVLVEETVNTQDTRHQLILESKNDPSDEHKKDVKWTTVAKKGLNTKLKDIPASKFSVTTDGKASILFPDKVSMQRATDALSEDYKVTASSKEDKKLLPKLKILNVGTELLDGEREVVQESIVNSICNKNPKIAALLQDKGEETLKVVYYDRKAEFIVIQVSPKIKQTIKDSNDKIYLGLGKYHVRDHFYVIQCYHCQGLGHKAGSRFCKRKEETKALCLHCAGEHQSKDCKHKGQRSKQRCCNCSQSKHKVHRDNASSHTATDQLCPFMIQEKEYMISRTINSSESKNEYREKLQRMRKLRGQY